MAAALIDEAVTDLTRFLFTISLAETSANRVSTLIHDLPTEIMSMICESLDDGSLAHLRLVCRGLADKSALTFELRFFGSIITVLNPISLGILAEIAQNISLSKFVKVISISTEHGAKMTDREMWQCTYILALSLPNLLNLRTVQIDSATFTNSNDAESGGYSHTTMDGCRCGYRFLLRSHPSWGQGSRSNVRDFERTCIVVSDAFASCNLNEKIDLDMSATPILDPTKKATSVWRPSFEHLSYGVPELLREKVRRI
jgi:hypothetical protein